MSSKRYMMLLLLCVAVTSTAPALKRGKERLLELTVTPRITLQFNFSYGSDTTLVELTNELSEADQILTLRKEVKENPSNPRLLVQLGRLLKHSQTNEAHACFQQAHALAEKLVTLRPNHGLAHVDLGDACDELGKKQLAEKAYRTATQVSSNEWKCWTALGKFLDRQTYLALFPTNPAARQSSSGNEIPRPSPEMMEYATKSRPEATTCFDRAISLAPKEADAYLLRAWHKCEEERFDQSPGYYRNEVKRDGKTFSAALLSKSAVPDLQKAVMLQPNICQLVGLAAWFEWASIAMSPLSQGANRPTRFEDFPEDARRPILKAITQLAELGKSNDPKRAAAALEYLGAIRFMTQENVELAAADLRRAVALDPNRECAWDLLLGSLLESTSPEEFAAVCENRLNHRKSARNHLIFAKALFRRGSFEKSAAEAKAAIAMETNNVPAHLMLCAILLRQDKGVAGEEELKSAFTNADRLVKQSFNVSEGPDWWLVLGLNLAIGSAIDGEVDNAKGWLDVCQKRFPEDERIKEIRNALP